MSRKNEVEGTSGREPLDTWESRQRRGSAGGREVETSELQARFAAGTCEMEKLHGEDGETPASIHLSVEDVAQIVHDLKNPLSTIALELSLLDDRLVDVGRGDLRAAIARISSNVAFIDRIVHELLDAGAIDAGPFELHRHATDMRVLLEHVIDRAVPTRDKSRVFLEAPCTATIAIDDLRIERVVANLISNALKYAPRSSGIVVRLDTTRDVVRISVIDAGVGVTDTEVTRIFDKYRRGTREDDEGSGLGLYVSRQIVDAHGGRLDVESIRGSGTCFFFELPRR